MSMKLAFVSRPNALDIKAYSGIPYNIAQSLQSVGCDIHYITPLEEQATFGIKAKHYVYRKYIKQSFLRDREPPIIRQYWNQVRTKLLEIKPDIILSIDSLPFASVNTEINAPLVIWGEATFNNCYNFYPWYKNLCKESYIKAEKADRLAYEKASLLIFPSEWAVNNAINHYGVDASKVKAIPYGANLLSNPNFDSFDSIISARLETPLKFLYMGTDWSRKGGNKVVEVVRTLNRQGYPAELHILGARWIDPKILPFEPFIINHGFVDKSTVEGKELFERIFQQSTFFIMLSVAETFGIVYCEASAYGVPSIAHDVGGVSSAVINNQNGKLFPLHASVEEITNWIIKITSNPEQYTELVHSSYQLFARSLNWQTGAQQVKKYMENLIK
ncbi:glycosyl transferase group 1 [Sphaerospermopsis reniformis]|uniref:Glycosyl transferase group 1 n=2 Tax=Sphaerospermopsis reniformis TaxID=531300 RepID=A0A479ZUA2_9CYAN|nr:glycosyl transferase group 1 [Sphaerospermopsis reniformis]